MGCYNPMLAFDAGIDELTGKHKVKILPKRLGGHLSDLKSYRRMYGDNLLLLPCGHCLGCLKDYRSSWAVRILLEASLYEHNCFITLTYDEKHLPKDNKPHKEEIVKFFKRLRAEGIKCRYFYCGEKGDKSGRAHYHAIIFGYDFPDKTLLCRTSSGSLIYESKLLQKLWTFGLSSVGDVDPGSACYVAQYSNKKKLTGIDDGCFVGMSRRPGLGCEKFNLRWFKSDTIYCALGAATIPRFFHKMLEGLDPQYYGTWKANRKARTAKRIGDQYIHGMREEEAYLYNENIDIQNYIRKMRGSL